MTRCDDLHVTPKDVAMKKFEIKVNEMCQNRKLNLTNMMIGPRTAQLLSKWLMTEQLDITHLLLSQNNLGDEGVQQLANPIAMSK